MSEHYRLADRRLPTAVAQTLWDLRAALVRALGLRECGGYGGLYTTIGGSLEPRWCRKPFGHSDSCAYEFGGDQPGLFFRGKFRGFR